MSTLKECFKIILLGDEIESRLAARQVRKLLYSSQGYKEEFNDIKYIISGAFGEYYKIAEDWRQENFIIALSVIYYLHDKEERPDFLFPWFFQLLQHQNGYIRHATVKMITQELGPLTVHIRLSDDKMFFKDRLTPEKADRIIISLFISLHDLMNVFWIPKYKKYKYINSLPASPYKSVQMILAEMEYLCGREYMNKLKVYLYNGSKDN